MIRRKRLSPLAMARWTKAGDEAGVLEELFLELVWKL